MAYKKTRKIKIGKQMTSTGFGVKSSSKSMRSGGFKRSSYGIKGFFGVVVYECWGTFYIK